MDADLYPLTSTWLPHLYSTLLGILLLDPCSFSLFGCLQNAHALLGGKKSDKQLAAHMNGRSGG